MSIYEFEQQGGTQRFSGVLKVKGGTGAPGDVPTQQANGDLQQAPGGGLMPGGAGHAVFPFTERATPGTYTAELPVLAGTIITAMTLRRLAGPWAADSVGLGGGDSINPTGYFDEANSDLNGFLTADYDLSALAFGSVSDPASLAGAYGQWVPGPEAIASGQGPGIRYPTDDTITFVLTTTIAAPPVVPVGVYVLEVYFLTPAAPGAVVFS